MYHYRITIVISDSLESVSHGGDRGWLSIQLNGEQRNSGNVRLSPEYILSWFDSIFIAKLYIDMEALFMQERSFWASQILFVRDRITMARIVHH